MDDPMDAERELACKFHIYLRRNMAGVLRPVAWTEQNGGGWAEVYPAHNSAPEALLRIAMPGFREIY